MPNSTRAPKENNVKSKLKFVTKNKKWKDSLVHLSAYDFEIQMQRVVQIFKLTCELADYRLERVKIKDINFVLSLLLGIIPKSLGFVLVDVKLFFNFYLLEIEMFCILRVKTN